MHFEDKVREPIVFFASYRSSAGLFRHRAAGFSGKMIEKERTLAKTSPSQYVHIDCIRNQLHPYPDP